MPKLLRSTYKAPRQLGRKAPISSRRIVIMMVVPIMEKATRLDREADHALAWGQHQRAETLSRRAAELREWSV